MADFAEVPENFFNSTVVDHAHRASNIFDWGAVSSGAAWAVESATGGFTSTGWPLQTNKGSQLNYSGTQGKDNDPAFTSTTNVILGGASICIGTAYVLKSISRDIRGYISPN